MSRSDPRPSHSDLEFARKAAKQWLRRCRAGASDALARMRAVLPRWNDIPDGDMAQRLRLADVQHALARESGFDNWAALKRHAESLQPTAELARLFLEAVREERRERSRELLASRPAIASSSLHAAAAAVRFDALDALLTEAPPQAAVERDTVNWSPLLYLCASPVPEDGAHDERMRCAAALLERGADPKDAVTAPGSDPPAPLAALYFACMRNCAPLVRLLLERGADSNDGESVYHAAQHNHQECLEVLLAHGADLSGVHPHWGNTPLVFLAGHHDSDAQAPAAVEGMRWLLEHGADPNVAEVRTGETPLLRVVAMNRDAALVELLLTHGADPNVRSRAGRPVHALAVRAGNPRTRALLDAFGARGGDETAAERLVGACMRGDRAEATALLASQAGLLEHLSPEDRGMLAAAAIENRAEAVALMLELGFDAAWEAIEGGTALHHAAWRGNAALCRLLLERGAPVDARDSSYGSSPIGWASHGSMHCRYDADDYLEVVDILLRAAATYDAAVNRWGEGPETLAVDRVAQRLHDRGFVPSHRDA